MVKDANGCFYTSEIVVPNDSGTAQNITTANVSASAVIEEVDSKTAAVTPYTTSCQANLATLLFQKVLFLQLVLALLVTKLFLKPLGFTVMLISLMLTLWLHKLLMLFSAASQNLLFL